MAPQLPKPVVAAIELALTIAKQNNKKPNMEAIASIFNTSYSSVSHVRRRMERIEEKGYDDRRKPGKKPLPNQDKIAEAMTELVHRRPDIQQKEVSEYVKATFGVNIGQSTVSRMMRDHGVPHKQSNKFYRKSKLISSNPEGKILTLPQQHESPGSQNLLASASSELPIAPYQSPYSQPRLPSANSTLSVSQPSH